MSKTVTLPETYVEPKIKDYKGDMERQWYIDWQIYNENTDSYDRKRCYLMNKYADYNERVKATKKFFKEIDDLLKSGATIALEEINEEIESVDLRTCTFIQAMEFAKQCKFKERLSDPRKADYKSHLKILYEWLEKIGKKNIPFNKVSTQFIHKFFDYLIEERDLENKTYNNYRTTLHALYETLNKRSDFDVVNIIAKIDAKEASSGTSHKPYSAEDYKKIIDHVIEQKNTPLLLAIGLIYYCFIRPTEVIKLKRMHLDEKVIMIPGRRNSKVSKTNYRQIPKTLEGFFKEAKVRKLKPEDYLISSELSKHESCVGKNFIYKKLGKVLKELKLDKKGYDLYGFKHTGNIALYTQKKNIRLNMLQNGHTNIDMTKVYLRDLGIVLEDDLLDFN